MRIECLRSILRRGSIFSTNGSGVELPSRVPTDAIPPRDRNEAVPLSFSQEQVWLHAQLLPETPLYNEPVTIHYSGDLNVFALERSFNEILRRHEAWRTCFKVTDGEPWQEIKPELSISLPIIDLRHFPAEQRESTALSIATEDARKPLDLAQAPLFRVRLIRLEDEQYRLFLVLSHIIFDGVAIYRVFLPELAALYQARVAGLPVTVTTNRYSVSRLQLLAAEIASSRIFC